MSTDESNNANDGQSRLTVGLGLPEYLRETWPLRDEFGEITTKQRRAIHEAADEIDRLRGALVTGASLLEQGCNALDMAASMRRAAEAHNAL